MYVDIPPPLGRSQRPEVPVGSAFGHVFTLMACRLDLQRVHGDLPPGPLTLLMHPLDLFAHPSRVYITTSASRWTRDFGGLGLVGEPDTGSVPRTGPSRVLATTGVSSASCAKY
jgi:hypothetical protein